MAHRQPQPTLLGTPASQPRASLARMEVARHVAFSAACGLTAAVCTLAAARAYRRSRSLVRGPAIRHVVQLAFKPGSAVADILSAFDEMCTKMPDLVQAYERGEQCSPEPHTKGLTHVFVLTFASPADSRQGLAAPRPSMKSLARSGSRRI